MKAIFSYDNRFFRFMSCLFDLMVLNLLWVITSLPLITIGASTCAMFRVILNRQQCIEGFLIKDYFRAFARDFKRAFIAGILILFCSVILLFEITFWSYQTGTTAVLCVIFCIAAIVYFTALCIYLFPVLILRGESVIHSCISAFLIAVQNLPKTLLLLSMIISTVYVAVHNEAAAMIFLCVGGSGFCYIVCLFVLQMHRKYETGEKEQENGFSSI